MCQVSTFLFHIGYATRIIIKQKSSELTDEAKKSIEKRLSERLKRWISLSFVILFATPA